MRKRSRASSSSTRRRSGWSIGEGAWLMEPASRLLQGCLGLAAIKDGRMKSPRVIAFLVALALSVTVCAADKRPITPQDLWACKRLGGPALSPDGTTAAFTVQEWSIEKNKSTSNLWLVEV